MKVRLAWGAGGVFSLLCMGAGGANQASGRTSQLSWENSEHLPPQHLYVPCRFPQMGRQGLEKSDF